MDIGTVTSKRTQRGGFVVNRHDTVCKHWIKFVGVDEGRWSNQLLFVPDVLNWITSNRLVRDHVTRSTMNIGLRLSLERFNWLMVSRDQY